MASSNESKQSNGSAGSDGSEKREAESSGVSEEREAESSDVSEEREAESSGGSENQGTNSDLLPSMYEYYFSVTVLLLLTILVVITTTDLGSESIFPWELWWILSQLVIVGILLLAIILVIFAFGRDREPAHRGFELVLVMFIGFMTITGLHSLKFLQTAYPEYVDLLRAAVMGASLGGATYVLINILGLWRDLREADRDRWDEHMEPWLKIRDLILEGLNRAIKMKDFPPTSDEPTSGKSDMVVDWEINYIIAVAESLGIDPSDFDESENGTPGQEKSRSSESKKLTLIELHDGCVKRIKKLRRDSHDEVKWKEFAAGLDFHRQFIHVLMGIGLAVGFTLLGSVLGIDALSPKGEGQDPNYISALGFSFLVGLYPRVFEKSLKSFADRLVDQREEKRAS